MKNLILAAAAFVSLNAFAAKNEVVAKCTNGEEIQVKVVKTGMNYRADVTVESVGGSYPTYHYKNIVQEMSKRLVIYTGPDFHLQQEKEGSNVVYLTIKWLGLNGEKLICM
jgi:hypothetical protein